MFDAVTALLRQHGATELKATPGAFTRGGPLSPELLLTLLLSQAADGGRRGYQLLLDAAWDELKRCGIPLPTEHPVSAAALCKARRKLSLPALRRLLLGVGEDFDATHGQDHRYLGRRVFAVDGSKINTQRAPALWSAFGGPEGGHCPQLLVTTLIDAVAKCPRDAIVAPYASSEDAGLQELLPHLKPGDILLLDRNYPSYALLQTLRERGIDFVIRVSVSGSFNAVRTFLSSGRDDCPILLGSDTAPGTSVPALIPVRAVRRDRPDEEEPMVLLTSLPRRSFTRGEIVTLYGMRWEVEQMFRIEKSDAFGHHQFHAKSPEGVAQEVLAFLLYLALCRSLQAAAATVHEAPYHELAERGTLFAVSAALTHLLLSSEDDAVAIRLESLLTRIARRRTPKRPGRSFPRRSFRPRLRWGPSGPIRAGSGG